MFQKGNKDAWLVTIIVPVFNDVKYLPACLDSLLEQTYTNIEILCVNDGSTDKSGEILEQYCLKDSRIKVFQGEHRGPGPARNIALKNMKGKYVLFCDADDSLEPETVEECAAVMEQRQCDIVVFNANIIEDGRSVAGLKNKSGQYISLVNKNNEGVMNASEIIKIMLLATVWGKMFRGEYIKKSHLEYTAHMVGEDSRFLLSYLMLVKNGYALNEALYNYYLRLKPELFHAKHPWMGRLMRFPGIFLDVSEFAIRCGHPLRINRFFEWLYVFFKSRRA